MIGFRVDANEKVATGHLMRCIAIATACIKKGKQCMFLLAEEKETQRLKSRGIPYQILGTKWDDMESEKDRLMYIFEKQEFEYMVVDSYQVTISYLKWLNSRVPVLYIDDMACEIYRVGGRANFAGDCRAGTASRRFSESALTGFDLRLRIQFFPGNHYLLPYCKREFAHRRCGEIR